MDKKEKAEKSEIYDVENTVIKIKNAYSDKLSESVQKTPLLLTIEHFDFNKDFFLFSWIGLNFFATKTYRISDPNSHRTNLHYHDNFEMIYVIKGVAHILIDDHFIDINHGECVIINRNIPHLERPKEDCEFVLISLSNHFLKTIIENDYVITENNEINKRMPFIYKRLLEEMTAPKTKVEYWRYTPTIDTTEITSKTELKFAEMVTTMNQKATGFYFHMQELLVQFFCVLNEPSMYQLQPFMISVNKSKELFNQITDILEKKDGLITRTELAKKMNYDDHHLNRIVQQITGKSLVEYARTFTTRKAAEYLITTQMTTEEIIQALGFSNKTYFFNLFKQTYGITPKQYRETFARKETL